MEFKNGDVFWGVGVMSGSSLDGIDIALCRFKLNENNTWSYRLELTDHQKLTQEIKDLLEKSPSLSSQELHNLDAYYGDWIGHHVNEFLHRHFEKPDFVAVHGHTVFHYPEKGFSIQLGDGAHIAAACQTPVITNFRQQNIALGGQGAPLVPFGDKLLFSEYDACINLGGIANISVLNQENTTAWDICPCNQVFNYLAHQIGQEFDRDGVIAISGKVIPELLSDLNQLDFYKKATPKSMGNHWIKEKVIPLIDSYKASIPDKMKTAQQHFEEKIIEAVREYDIHKILLTGGGAFNKALISDLFKQEQLEFIVPDIETVEFKEALIFAFLGLMRWHEKENILASYTGARKNCSGGVISLP